MTGSGSSFDQVQRGKHTERGRVCAGNLCGLNRLRGWGGVWVVALVVVGLLALAPGCARVPPPAPVAAVVPPALTTLTPEQVALNVESFDQIWTTIRDHHFDPNLNNADWPGAKAELRPKVEQATTMSEARAAMNELLARLRQTHFGVIPAEAFEVDVTGDEEAGEAAGAGAARGAGEGQAAEAPARPRDRAGSLGFEVQAVEGKLLVTRVVPGSKAEAAGIRAGWEVVVVGARKVRPVLARVATMPNLQGLPATFASTVVGRRLLHTAPGELVHVGFLDGRDRAQVASIRAGEPEGVPVTLGNLPTEYLVLRREILPGNIGYLYVNIWLDPTRTARFLEESVRELAGVRGVIIDLRGNPGGLGILATTMASFFTDERNRELGTLITRQFRQRFVLNPRPGLYRGPVAVLVDEMSMSTSEIFAAGMQDLGRARVFGVRTPGAALPSIIVNLPNGDRLQYAFANYISFSGKALEGNGVIPDETVPLTRRALLGGVDPVIAAAVRWIETLDQGAQPVTISTVSGLAPSSVR